MEACKSQETLLELALERTENFHPAFQRVIQRTQIQGIKFGPGGGGYPAWKGHPIG